MRLIVSEMVGPSGLKLGGLIEGMGEIILGRIRGVMTQ